MLAARQGANMARHSPPLRRNLASAATPSDVRPLIATLPSRQRYPYKEPELTIDHLVIGGGVVGLSIAAELARRWPEKTTYLVERHTAFGEETSSRNSEVIHAGLYYPRDSLKTRLCLRGRELMYHRCQQEGIAYRQTQKLVVGAAFAQGYLDKLKAHCDSLGPLAPPTRLLSGDEARELEPDLSPDIACALLSERTGIVSSHELMASLERELLDADNAEVVYDTRVVRLDPAQVSDAGSAGAGGKRGTDGSRQGWVVQTVTSEGSSSSPVETASAGGSESDALLAKVVINSSGLNGPMVLNSLVSSQSAQQPLIPMWYSKGNYASYKGPGTERVRHLIYPVPDTRGGGGAHSHTSLGTHLTLDLDGNVRFGPDTEWISPPPPPPSSSTGANEDAEVESDSHIDFWRRQLTVDESRLESMYESIKEYLPSVRLEGLSADYAGIRPKLIGPTERGFRDFTMLWHRSADFAMQRVWQGPPSLSALSSSSSIGGESEGSSVSSPSLSPGVEKGGGGGRGGAMLTLLGIESPGLTSSLAIGEMVGQLVASDYYGERVGGPQRRQIRNKGARNEDVGGVGGVGGVEDWA